MDLRVAIGVVAALFALTVLCSMEPGLMRLFRLRWNGYWRTKQRKRATAGFVMRRSTSFRDGALR